MERASPGKRVSEGGLRSGGESRRKKKNFFETGSLPFRAREEEGLFFLTLHLGKSAPLSPPPHPRLIDVSANTRGGK